MKPRLAKPLQIIALCLASTHLLRADSATWNGSALDALSLWSDVNNWDGPPVTVPGSGNIATFNSAGSANDVIDLGAGVTINSIVFDTVDVAAYTIGSGGIGAQSLTLENSGSIVANSGINANQIFNANLTLGTDGSAQSYALTNSDNSSLILFEGTITGGTGGTPGVKTINVNTSSSGGFIMKGVVSNGGATSLGMVKTGTGQLNLASVAHTFSGGMAIEEGLLTISGSGSANNSSISLGAAGNTGSLVRIAVVNSGTNPTSPLTIVDQTSGTATTRMLGTNSSTSGQWSGPITMDDDLTVSTATAGAFTLQTGASVNLNANTLTLSAATNTPTAAANVVVKGKISGSGNVTVNNTGTAGGITILEGTAHDYTGTTTISAGTLQIGTGAAAGSIATTSGISNSGVLDYKRTGSLNQGGPISGTGLVRVTAGGTVTFDKANTYSGTTTIGGGGKITVATGGSIAPTTGNSLTLGSGGSGTLQYDSATTSKFSSMSIGTGGTNASGTLNQTNGVINGISMTLGGGNSGSFGGIVAIGNASGYAAELNISGDLSIGGSGTYNSTLTVKETGTLNVTGNLKMATSTNRSATGTITQNAGSTVTAASLSLSTSFNHTSSSTHTSVYNLNGGVLSVGSITTGTPGAGTPPTVVMTMNNTFNFGGGTLKATASDASYWANSGYTTANVKDGGAKIDTAGFDIAISQPLLKFAGSTTDTLTKDGLGTLTLGGTNTYTGATTVNAGTLEVTGSLDATDVEVKSSAALGGTGALGGNATVRTGGHLAFDVADTTGSQDPLTITGSLTLEANTVIDLNAAAPPAVGGPYVLLTATGGISGSLGSFTFSGVSGSVAINGNNLELTVTAPAGYAAWAATPAFGLTVADQDPNHDPDNDGMDNLLEFVLNGNPGSSDPSILPDLVVTATDFEFTYQRRDDAVSPETTQTFQWGSTLATWPGSAIIPATSGPAGAATITISPGTPDNAVTDTVKISIPKSETGGSGKLFGRLQVTKP